MRLHVLPTCLDSLLPSYASVPWVRSITIRLIKAEKVLLRARLQDILGLDRNGQCEFWAAPHDTISCGAPCIFHLAAHASNTLPSHVDEDCYQWSLEGVITQNWQVPLARSLYNIQLQTSYLFALQQD